MSSTNKTTYYELSQYLGSDKPTYLGDYNADMGKIDAGIHTAKNTADTNTTNIGTLTNLTTEVKSNLVGAINEVDSHADTNATNIGTLNTSVATNTSNIGTMANLTTTVKDALVNAINELKVNIDNFNLTNYANLSNASITNANISNNQLKLANNSDGSLAKVYGFLSFTASGGDTYLTITGSGLNPSSDITINCAGLLRISDSTGLLNVSSVDLVIKTNGNIEINTRSFVNGQNGLVILWPCLYFIKDFGDVPINP